MTYLPFKIKKWAMAPKKINSIRNHGFLFIPIQPVSLFEQDIVSIYTPNKEWRSKSSRIPS
ncbi:hypothetical protein EBU02_13135 [bacterium]|nr:hypothetical protein [bacterium]